MRTIAEMLRWRARRHPSLPAVWFEGKSQGYGELDASSSQLAAGFVAKLGLAPGDRVAILDKNSAAYLELFFALDKAGLVAAPLNWRLTPHEVKQIIDDIKPQADRHRAGIQGACRRDRRAGDDVRRLAARRRRPDARRRRRGVLPVLHLGHHRPSQRRDAHRLERAQCRALHRDRNPGDPRRRPPSCLSTHVPHRRRRLGDLGDAAGLGRVIVRETVPDSLLKTMVEQKVETALLAPTLMLFLTELPQARSADFSALKHIIYGTAPISPDLLRRSLETFKCRFSQLYGLTETTGPFTSLGHEYHSGERLWSCGRPMFGGRVRVVDAEDNDLPPHQVGEILYQGENLMAGYWAREEATAEAMRGGWFHTGDAGYLDADGFIFLKDRIKDMIVSGGENVYPAEVEGVLMGHPEILECAVIGVPDPKWGETVKAVVVRRAGATLTEAALLEWTRDKLAGFKRPRSVDFIDTLPRNASGKLLKRTLREPYWQGYARRVN